MGKTLYVTDLDGTLLNSESRISPKTAEIIGSLVEKGMCFSYATARSLVSASVAAKGLSAKFPVIAYNGCLIAEPQSGKILDFLSFSEAEQQAARECILSHNVYPVVYSFTDGREYVSWMPEHENEGIIRYTNLRKADNDPRLHPVRTVEELFAGKIFYYTCIGEKEELFPIYDTMKNREGFISTIQQELYRSEYWCELMPSAASKKNAIIKLKKLLGCDRVVSFGDAVNDLPMFEISDECYAVAGAVPELKNAATAVIAGNDEDAVAEWLLKNAVF